MFSMWCPYLVHKVDAVAVTFLFSLVSMLPSVAPYINFVSLKVIRILKITAHIVLNIAWSLHGHFVEKVSELDYYDICRKTHRTKETVDSAPTFHLNLL